MKQNENNLLEKRLKVSKYTFFIEWDYGYLVYSSATGALIKICREKYIDKTKNLLEGSEEIYMDDDDEYIRTLFDNGILVPYERDEFSYQKFLYEQSIVNDRILKLTLLTTRQCNLRCIYCYEEHSDRFMSDETYAGIINMIDNLFCNRVYNGVGISLFGGEPFYDFDRVYTFLINVKNICEKYQCSYTCNATTNGVLVTPERFEKLISAECANYQISIDGIKETHDKHRVKADGSGSWERIMSNLKYMKETSYNFRVVIRTNFDEEIICKADEFYRYIKENFDDRRFVVYYENIKKLGGKNDDALLTMNNEEKTAANISVSEVLAKYNLKCELTESRSLPFGQMCPAVKHNSYIIDCDGTLMKCTLAIDDEVNKVGRITEDGEIKLDSDKLSKWMIPNCEHAECRECRLLPLCFGRKCVNAAAHGERFFCNYTMRETEFREMLKKSRS